ncbi:MAG: hypothetical protein WD058_01810 [Dehalococcoidia bacterium]
MGRFEEAFAAVERAAAAAGADAQRLVRISRTLERAAQDGNLNAMRRSTADLRSALDTTQQAVANARQTWAFSEDQEQAYLADGYTDELLTTAKQEGLLMRSEDARILVYPSVLRVQAGDGALRIDRRLVRTLRPTRLVQTLKTAQTRPPKFRGRQFLASLQKAYRSLLKADAQTGETVRLLDVYELFTMAPGSDYSREEFARDLNLLSIQGPATTTDGERVQFPSSTGTSGAARRLFPTIDEHGETVTFYGLRFIKT